jgi:hypothetical protein
MNGSADAVDDTITLTSAGKYTLDCGNNTNGNANGDLDYESSDNLTITFAAPGRATIEIDQTGTPCATDRVIHHRGTGALTLERVRITGGDLTDVNSFSAHGGGILSDGVGGTLILNDVSVEGNRSSAGGVTPKGPQGGRGGGIAIWRGSATITDNSAGGAGNATGTPIANGATIKLSAQGTI